MDPIAHTLFGATLAEAGLKRKTALATGTLIIGANIPDIDVIAMFWGTDYALLIRRGWTHGVLALTIWPFLLTGLMLLYERYWRRRQRRARNGPKRGGAGEPGLPSVRPGALLAISFAAVWSHPILDWLNTYGIRLLMPFDDTWFYGDILFIIDPWMWLLTGAAVVLVRSGSWPGIAGWVVLAAATTALVTDAAIVPVTAKIMWCAGVAAIFVIRWQGWFRGREQWFATVCLGVIGLYLIFMFTGSRMTVWQARTQLAERGIAVQRIMAGPLPSRPLLRDGVAASDSHYYRFRINWMDRESFRLTGNPVPAEQPDRIVQAALRSPGVQGLRGWMRFPAYEVRQLDDGWRVFIRDIRFVAPGQEEDSGIGIAIVDLDEELRVR